MRVATTTAVATTSTLRAPTTSSSSSMAKTRPPSGVSKVAAMPAPAPAATRMRRSAAPIGSTCPSVEPKAEPICTIGPSRPTEAPEPIEMAEASDFTSAICGRMRPSLKWMESITSGTPCPLASGAKLETSQATSTPPTTGARITQAPKGGGAVCRLAS